jgi:DNA-binding transcriptional MerR regulator
MKKLTLSEVRKRLEKEHSPIKPRNFQYYQRLGLLPKPEKKVGAKGRGVYGYYMPSIIKLIKYIYLLKDRGYELNDILEEGNRKIIEKFDESFRKWGKLDMPLQKTKGFDEFKRRVLKTYNLWDVPGKIEYGVLHYIQNKINDLLPGLEKALFIIKKDLDDTKDKKERKALERNIKRLNRAIEDYKDDLQKIYKRIGEIDSGGLKPEEPILMWKEGNRKIM